MINSNDNNNRSKIEIDDTTKWYTLKPKSVRQKEYHKILWDTGGLLNPGQTTGPNVN